MCVYRKRVKKALCLVQLIYIFGNESKSYIAPVEFDLMSMVEAGEGITYQSKPVELSTLVRCIEAFSNSPINERENFTRSGKAPFYDSEDITAEHYQKSWSVLSDRYDNGRSLLPSGLIFG